MNFLVIVALLGGIILMSIIGALLATKCPNCKKLFSLKWQPEHQRDICKHGCGYTIYVKHFVPPKASYLRWLHKYSPLTYKKENKNDE
ncbi:MAG: hypothetical protein PVG65_05235 [Candidatus Thorarchaeota archaeon]|jgi:hypothetical protein